MSQTARDRLLEDFCTQINEVAKSRSGRKDLKTGASDSGLWRFHCPMEGHQWKGDDQPGWAVLSDGEIKAGCRKCTPRDSGREEAYTEELKALIGWNDAATLKATGVDTIREHEYDTIDYRFRIRHAKLKKGRADAYWQFYWRHTDSTRWKRFGKGQFQEFLENHYPSLSVTHHCVLFYQDELFRKPDGKLLDVYQPVVMEGEKDAKTFNRLMGAVKAGCIATALPVQQLRAISVQQAEVLQGRVLTIVGDDDDGGEAFIKSWSAAAWDVTKAIKVFPRETFAGGDFTDWVQARLDAGETEREVAQDVLSIISSIQELSEPLVAPTAWLHELRKSKTGGVSSTNIMNAKLVWTKHPDLQDKLRLNAVTGEIEIVDPPWLEESGVMVGAKKIATAVSIWLDETSHVTITPKTFEDATHVVATTWNPHEDKIVEGWDGEPRVDALFTRYIPLDVVPGQATIMARIAALDLVRKLRGDLEPQRMLVGIETKQWVDLATAFDRDGTNHTGRLADAATYTKAGAGVVQVDMDTVAHRTAAPGSVPALFSKHVLYRDGTKVAAPYFIALGPAKTSKDALMDVNDKILFLKLTDPIRNAELRMDASQLYAEVLSREAELAATPMIPKDEVQTADKLRQRVAVAAMIQAFIWFATKDVPLSSGPVAPNTFESAPSLDEPRRHIVRDQFLSVMHYLLMEEWNKQSERIWAFRQVCNQFNLPGQVGLTRTLVRSLNLNPDDIFTTAHTQKTGKAAVLGTYLKPENLMELRSWNIMGEFEHGSNSSSSQNPAGFTGSGNPFFTGEESGSGDAIDSSMSHARVRVTGAKRVKPEVADPLIYSGVDIDIENENGKWIIFVDGVKTDSTEVVEDLTRALAGVDTVEILCDTPALLERWMGEWAIGERCELDGLVVVDGQS